ncbi:MAG: glycogen/starch synthase [Balneolaceae bacterium]
MRILHISAECYPAAKAGGLGDVVGALPKYLNRRGHETSVIIPKYKTGWIGAQQATPVFEGKAPYNLDSFEFTVEQVENPQLGYPLYLVDIPGKFDREGIYFDPWSGQPFWDEMDRFFCFQIAVLEWVIQSDEPPGIVHSHDHHASLVPFMMTRCYRYDKLAAIPTVVTIHNGEYQGRYDRYHYTRLPAFDLDEIGLLDWDGNLNALASGIKCAWRVTTVSKGYLNELMDFCHGLEQLLKMEQKKTSGLLNGIDMEVWNPETDPFLQKNYSLRNRVTGKKINKEFLCGEFGFNEKLPLFSFIGRLAREKGADLVADLIASLTGDEPQLNILVLGTGDPDLHRRFNELSGKHAGYFNSRLEYNEKLAHRIYAGSDFLIMPSRIEPCGLNQMYAMRYGTVPVARSTGGLADTIIDISDTDGYGVLFREFTVSAAGESVRRSMELYNQRSKFSGIIKKVMKLDFSWEKASLQYENLYKQLT